MSKTQFINQQLRILETVLKLNKQQRELVKQILSYTYEEGTRDKHE